MTALGPGAQRTRFRVEESFRGPAGAVVDIVAQGIGGSCDYAFVHGTQYLVFARQAPDGTWRSLYCEPTGPVEKAGDALAFARGIARDSRRPGSILGFVSVADKHGGVPTALGQATIAIKEGSRSFSTVTDSGGKYELKDVPPGRYVLTVRASPRSGYGPPAIVQVKGPGACVVHNVSIPAPWRDN